VESRRTQFAHSRPAADALRLTDATLRAAASATAAATGITGSAAARPERVLAPALVGNAVKLTVLQRGGRSGAGAGTSGAGGVDARVVFLPRTDALAASVLHASEARVAEDARVKRITLDLVERQEREHMRAAHFAAMAAARGGGAGGSGDTGGEGDGEGDGEGEGDAGEYDRTAFQSGRARGRGGARGRGRRGRGR
jgi:hypothetical protein